MPIDEQDREWTACFFVLAPDEDSAKNWGDTVVSAYCSGQPVQEFLRSYIDDASEGWSDTTPTVALGEMPTDEQIGW